MKFRSDVAGTVTGVRFYKGSRQHRHPRRARCGPRPARCSAPVTFTGETATRLAAGHLRHAGRRSPRTRPTSSSYFAPDGHYAADAGYFADGRRRQRAAARARPTASTAPNGVYRYGTGGGFPTSTYQSTQLLGRRRASPTSCRTDRPRRQRHRAPDTDACRRSWSSAVDARPGRPGRCLGTCQRRRPPPPARARSGRRLPTPATPSDPDTSAVEVGVKFRSDVDGHVTGIRFYKGTGNTGTHVGHLWTPTGTLLATATFTGESATGWQQVTFATPVADHGEHHVRRVVLRAGRPLLRRRTAVFARRRRQRAAARARRRRSTAATASTATAPAAASRPAPSSRPTTGSTSSSHADRRRHDAADGDVASPAAGATGVPTTATGRRRRSARRCSRRPCTFTVHDAGGDGGPGHHGLRRADAGRRRSRPAPRWRRRPRYTATVARRPGRRRQRR